MKISFLNGNSNIISGNSFLEKLDFLYDMYETTALIPLFFFTVYRFYYQLPIEEYMGTDNEKKRLPKYSIDNFLKIATIYPLIYFNLQTVLQILSGKYENLSNLIHLLQSITLIIALWTSMSINYYPWFLISPVALYFLNNISSWYYFGLYILFITNVILCLVGLRLSPWKLRNNYQFIARLIITLVILSVINHLINN
jgi:hypothetical protein